MKLIVLFLSIITAGLLAGGLFVIWIEYGAFNVTAEVYLKQQQNVVKADLNTVMPLLGRVSAVATLIAAYLLRKNKTALASLLIAVLFLIVAGAVTRLGNQPVNDIVINWRTENIPSDWIELREKWNTLHFIRTIASIVAFSLITYTAVYKLDDPAIANNISSG